VKKSACVTKSREGRVEKILERHLIMNWLKHLTLLNYFVFINNDDLKFFNMRILKFWKIRFSLL
jgi:hypothetical protein